jgi:uncharacterized protein (DUF488 family)
VSPADSITPGAEEGPRAPVIYSIGHGARPIEVLLGVLAGHGVRHLVDVRTAPGSAKHPQFGKDRLAATLRDAGIEYTWRKDLGGWRKPVTTSPHTALRSSGFRGYADYMETPEFEAATSWLMDRARSEPTAFMCAESLWSRCHRRMIADALTAKGWNVIHLVDAGRAEPHRFHPNARMEGTRILYDIDPSRQEPLFG